MAMIKTMVSIPKGLLQELDELARQEERSRSEVLREAVRLFLELRRSQRHPGLDPRVQRAVAIQDRLAEKHSVPWDGVAEIRRWREKR